MWYEMCNNCQYDIYEIDHVSVGTEYDNATFSPRERYQFIGRGLKLMVKYMATIKIGCSKESEWNWGNQDVPIVARNEYISLIDNKHYYYY